MKYIEHYSHKNGKQELENRNLYDWVTGIFEVPQIKISRGCTNSIREHVRYKLLESGWSGEIPIDPAFDLTVFSIGHGVAFQIQTGNITRAFYDLIKLQYLFSRGKIGVAILAVPSSTAAKNIGSNVANFSRIMNELALFNNVITLPLTLISFE